MASGQLSRTSWQVLKLLCCFSHRGNPGLSSAKGSFIPDSVKSSWMPVLILLSLFLLFDQILIFFRAQVKCQLNCNTSSSPHLHVLRVFLMELWDYLSYRIAFTCLSVALSCWTVSSSRPDTLSSPYPSAYQGIWLVPGNSQCTFVDWRNEGTSISRACVSFCKEWWWVSIDLPFGSTP